MLFRFALYGFLKNQRYFEPFFVLVLLEKGLSFFLVGLLVGFREIAVNLLEIPSGAVADVCGRRRSMILSFSAYIVSFLLFEWAESLVLLFSAMLLFAVGEAFRSGTHKAMILSWLESQGRREERIRVYGYTRSWSKFGSAVSVVLATLLVWLSGSYAMVFLASTFPYLLNIINFLGYPADLDGGAQQAAPLGRVGQHLRETFTAVRHSRPLRRLIWESMGFDGVFHATKDYLQPLLMSAVVAGGATTVAVSMAPGQTRRTALLVGAVYLTLHLLSGLASRVSHRFADAAGGEEAAARRLWLLALAIFAVLGISAYADLVAWVAAAFVAIHVIENLWRPVLVSRYDSHSDAQHGATVLSVEGQARRLSTMVLAPLLGLMVDAVMAHGTGGAYWPVGAVGVAAAVFFVLKPAPREALH